jgi:hypothetical protein
MAKKKWEVLSDGKDSGVAEWMRYNHHDNTMEVRSAQRVDSIIEANKAQYAQMDERTRWRDGMNHVASIPLVVIEQYKQRGIDLMKDQKELRKFLADPDNKYFRTRPGKV